MQKYISFNRLERILRRIYPNLKPVPVCMLSTNINCHFVFYKDKSYTEKVGETRYKTTVTPLKNEFMYCFDTIVLFDSNPQ